jgi:non-heme chloroperoxidase
MLCERLQAVPVLVMHSEDDQVVPYGDSGPMSAKLLPNGTLKTYTGFPHGMPTTQAETINADLLAFIRSGPEASTMSKPQAVGANA